MATREGKADEVDQRIDALHAEEPGRFVAARDALARELAAAGDRRAAAVKRLRRPTLLVSTLNRLARREAPAVKRLLDAGETLRAAHASALRGGGGEALRAADREVSEALDALVASARRELAAGGRSASGMLVRLRSVLRDAASSGGDVAAALLAGRVEREPEAADGFGVQLAGAESLPARAPSVRERARRPADTRARAAAVVALPGGKSVDLAKARRADEARRASEQDELRRRAAEQRAAARRLAGERRTAERERKRAAAALARAEAEVRRREREAADAERRADAARRALAAAGEALAAARRRAEAAKTRVSMPD